MTKKSFWGRLTESGLLLPIVSLLLVMAVNIVFDIVSGNNPFNFFMITLQHTTSNGNSRQDDDRQPEIIDGYQKRRYQRKNHRPHDLLHRLVAVNVR